MKITDEFVFFYGHQDPFSNFYIHPFIHNGIKFMASEQAFMYRKACHFYCYEIAEQILKSSSQKEWKRLGRSKLIQFNEEDWNSNREKIMKQVLYDKFKEEPMRSLLIMSYNKKLVETSPYDKIWGVGLSKESNLIYNAENWIGRNLLGICLEEVRDYFLTQMK